MNISHFKRFLAVGCSHGSLIDWEAAEKVLEFKDQFKPHTTVHLGDVIDYAAFRTGAHGTKDEATNIEPDIEAGVTFIRMLAPTDVLIGNHDVRVWKLAEHHNAIIRKAAGASRNEFLTGCNQAGVKRLIDSYDINRSWIELGDTKFLHGFMYNENAIRDHAEHFGKCVIAHLHVAGTAAARRSDHAVGYCVGTLADVSRMEYANTRRSTARWSHGFAWGYYDDRQCVVNISQCEQGNAKNWILP